MDLSPHASRPPAGLSHALSVSPLRRAGALAAGLLLVVGAAPLFAVEPPCACAGQPALGVPDWIRHETIYEVNVRQFSAAGKFAGVTAQLPDALVHMPGTMRRLAVVQFFTWLGLFCMWLHFSNAVPALFGATDPRADLFKRGVEWAGVCYVVKDAVTFVAAFALMAIARRTDRRLVHGVCLGLGAVGLLATGLIHGEENKFWLLAALALDGIAWASILSMPYAMLAGALPPERVGVYMGIFNFFIVLPEILAALFFGGLVKHVLHGDLVHAVMAGGVCLLLAACALVFVKPAPALAPSAARSRSPPVPEFASPSWARVGL